MRFLVGFGKELFATIVWVFAALIVGYFLLHWIENNAGGNILGRMAQRIEAGASNS